MIKKIVFKEAIMVLFGFDGILESYGITWFLESYGIDSSIKTAADFLMSITWTYLVLRVDS